MVKCNYNWLKGHFQNSKDSSSNFESALVCQHMDMRGRSLKNENTYVEISFLAKKCILIQVCLVYVLKSITKVQPIRLIRGRNHGAQIYL